MKETRRILWVKSGPLHPPDTGGKIRTLNMLREINRQRPVTYLSIKPAGVPLHPDEEPDGYATERLWIEKTEAARLSPKFFLELAGNFVTSKPFALTKHFSPECRRRLIELDASGGFDAIVCDFLAPALHFVDHRWRAPVFLFQHNMESQIWARLSTNHRSAMARWYFAGQARRMFHWEQKLSALFKGVITVSPEDSKFARERYGLTNVLGDVPPGVDTHFFAPLPEQQPDRERPTFAFLGSMDWLPNVEGVCWFARDVLPLILREVPAARLRIVGRRPAPEVVKLARENPAIEVTGTVEDVRPCLRDCMAVVVPLLSGGGTRIKILEAMALGVPVVSTTVGAEGLPFVSGEHLMLADDPAALTSACVRLCQDAMAWGEIAACARREVEARYSWAGAASRFLALTDTIRGVEASAG